MSHPACRWGGTLEAFVPLRAIQFARLSQPLCSACGTGCRPQRCCPCLHPWPPRLLPNTSRNTDHRFPIRSCSDTGRRFHCKVILYFWLVLKIGFVGRCKKVNRSFPSTFSSALERLGCLPLRRTDIFCPSPHLFEQFEPHPW